MRSTAIRTLFLCSIVLTLLPGLWAQPNAPRPTAKTLTVMVTGKLGPVLSGSDPLGLNGESGTLTLKASEGLSPTKSTTTTATYTLPVGAVSIKFGSEQFKSTTKSTLEIKLTSTADIAILSATGPEGLKLTLTTSLAPKSWTTGVLKHPAPFTPSPQTLKSATKAGGGGSQVKYAIDGLSTELGLKGSISNSDADDDMLYEAEQ
ncbi:MAG TPA: hypothetical protein VF753_10165 [Terriglobales bacterium]